jgi:hypothetical protein
MFIMPELQGNLIPKKNNSTLGREKVFTSIFKGKVSSYKIKALQSTPKEIHEFKMVYTL